MKTIALLLAAMLTLSIAADVRAVKTLPSAVPPALIEGNNQFAFDLYQRLAADSSGDIFVSPESISTALAMTYAGARGDTAEQMAKTLHFPLAGGPLHEAFAASLKELNVGDANRDYQLSIANRLWSQQGFQFLEPFLKITRDDYGAELGQLDFAHQADAARNTINSWVEKQTHDKIKDLIGPGTLTADMRLVLTNAIYFKGDWDRPFSKEATQTMPFHVTASKDADMQMMSQEAHFLYARTDAAQLLVMTYKGSNLAMLIVLPTKVDGLSAIEKSLTTENFNKWTSGLHEVNVAVGLPKFKATREIELSSVLSALGMRLAFSTSGADFSGMDGNRDLFLSAVIHKAFINVDELGTEAAAATEPVISATAFPANPPEEFTADHPFLFLIRDTHSGSILFMGRFTGPTN